MLKMLHLTSGLQSKVVVNGGMGSHTELQLWSLTALGNQWE